MYNFCLFVEWKSHSHFIKTPRQNKNLPYAQGKLNSRSYFKDLIYFRCCSFCGYKQQLSMNVPFSFLMQNNLTKPEFIHLTAAHPQTLSSTQTHTAQRGGRAIRLNTFLIPVHRVQRTAHIVKWDYLLQLKLQIRHWQYAKWWLQHWRNIHPLFPLYQWAIKQIQYTEKVCLSKPRNKSYIL